MYTSKSIKIHSKCLAILELIQTCNNRIGSNQADLNLFDHSEPLSMIRILNDRELFTNEIEKYKRIKNRLVNYYSETLLQLVKAPLEHYEKKNCQQREPSY